MFTRSVKTRYVPAMSINKLAQITFVVSAGLLALSAFASGLETPASDYQFMGCRPSVGECYNSCPTQNGEGFLADPNHPECAADTIEPVACYCQTAHNPDTNPEFPGEWDSPLRRAQ